MAGTEGGLRRRDVLKLAALAAVPGWLSACFKRERVLDLFNWSNYIGKQTLPEFQKETGIQVREDYYADGEEMFAKLKTGVRGYDLAVVDDYLIPRMTALGLLAKYPPGSIKNASNIEPEFLHPPYDPTLEYTIPYLWGTTGIAYNKRFIKKAPTSWRDLWNPEYKGKVAMLDHQRDVLGCALLLLGLPADSKDPAALESATALLVQQRPLLKHYTSSTYIDELVAGELWICQAWSGDTLQAGRENPDIDYIIPKEGSFMYVYSLCVLASSRSQSEAREFVDFTLRPQVAAEITATVRYPTANRKAVVLLPPKLSGDPRIYPPADIMRRLHFYPVLDDAASQAWNKAWQGVKLS